ncbi:MAG TPA: RluA family pseudouridine synthase [Solirubrobacteraceae bacterium]|jgi:23S rRNA pseudouridine1911/1915/1917 synthase|nr:RluA family pseudouridine synthase [Solirubrobacteraceae bacterium]
MEVQVPAEAAGERLDSFLGARVGSRAQAQRLLEDGRVSLAGRQVPKRHRVSPGETIVVDESSDDVAGARRRPGPRPAGDAVFGVSYEDDDLLVVEKPAGVVAHPSRGHHEGTLSQALAARGAAGGDPWRAGIVHRLDKDTSGLLVVAKHTEAHRRLKAALQARTITREYLVLVDGRPPARTGTIDAPLGRDRRVRTHISTDTDDPREARTHFELEAALLGSTLLRARLDTGRTHQIRAHFLAIGHPVCGDPEYGRAGVFGLERQFLHATRLRFDQPFTGAPIDVLSPLPDDLQAALALARLR